MVVNGKVFTLERTSGGAVDDEIFLELACQVLDLTANAMATMIYDIPLCLVSIKLDILCNVSQSDRV
jgi:hypothetical protein